MIRTIIKPISEKINLSIPAEYIGTEVEILVFPVSTTSSFHKAVNEIEDHSSKRQKAFQNFMKYKGTLPADFDYNPQSC